LGVHRKFIVKCHGEFKGNSYENHRDFIGNKKKFTGKFIGIIWGNQKEFKREFIGNVS